MHHRTEATARKGRIKDTLREFIADVDCDAIILLQPTSPFVRLRDIMEVEIILDLRPRWNSAQTVVKAPHNVHELNQRAMSDGAVSFVHRDRQTTKQSKPGRYIFGNVVGFRTAAFLEQDEVFAEPSKGIEIPWLYGFDADGPEDFRIGEQLVPLIDAS